MNNDVYLKHANGKYAVYHGCAFLGKHSYDTAALLAQCYASRRDLNYIGVLDHAEKGATAKKDSR